MNAITQIHPAFPSAIEEHYDPASALYCVLTAPLGNPFWIVRPTPGLGWTAGAGTKAEAMSVWQRREAPRYAAYVAAHDLEMAA